MCKSRRASEKKDIRHDLFSSLLDASDEEADGGAKLSDRELLGNIFVFLLAGHEVRTTELFQAPRITAETSPRLQLIHFASRLHYSHSTKKSKKSYIKTSRMY